MHLVVWDRGTYGYGFFIELVYLKARNLSSPGHFPSSDDISCAESLKCVLE